MRISRFLFAMPPMCGLVLLAGCLHPNYVAPVNTFQQSTASTISSISAFYSSRNSYEVQLYLDDVAQDPSIPVGKTDAQGRPTVLGKPAFSPASIKARLDALNLVGVYASSLNDLANTTAPADFQTAATALGTNLSSLGTTFQTLGAQDQTAAKYVGPVTSLIGTIGKMYLTQKRDEAIRESVNKGGPVVNEILSLLKDDMDNVFSYEVITGANQELAQAIVAYNTDRAKLSYEQRVARLTAIKNLSDSAVAAAGSVPSQLIDFMIAANNALLKSADPAQQKNKQVNLASLNAALSAWNAQLQEIATDIKPLIQ